MFMSAARHKLWQRTSPPPKMQNATKLETIARWRLLELDIAIPQVLIGLGGAKKVQRMTASLSRRLMSKSDLLPIHAAVN
jgi:hypothetical protein